MSQVVSLRCNHCGAPLNYDGKVGAYNCSFCGLQSIITYDMVNGTGGAGNPFEIVAGVLRSYSGASPLVRIPAGVAAVGAGCFQGLEMIESIELPEGIIKIEKDAFQGCTSLKYVSFPATLQSIGEGAFKESGLVDAMLPPSLSFIGRDAFMGCNSMKKAALPRGGCQISERAFKQCHSLGEVSCDLKEFCISFKSSLEAKKNGDTRPTLFDVFQATPYLQQLYSVQAAGQCVICGGAINAGVCQSCGTVHVDLVRTGCYIATAVYGSYDCREVWTLRRFRDQVLAKSLPGRWFISAYYPVSPTVVRLFGRRKWFNAMWRGILDRFVARLRRKGISDQRYYD